MYSWFCSVSRCLAEGYEVEISAAQWAVWLRKYFTFLLHLAAALLDVGE